MDLSLSKLQEMVKDKEAQHAAVHGSKKVRHDWEIEQQMYNMYDMSRTLDYFTDVELWVFSFLMLRQVTNTEK